ncbi:MAG: hypothetical protein LUH55_14520 [Bacteroides thetaiotaomicron]|nr:hypothetical protein [Bacteroides thetaiotaomicron]
MGIGDLFGKIGKNLNRPEKETPEGNISEINRIQSMPVYRENPYVRIILDMGANLDDITFGIRFLPDVDAVYRNFKIADKNELIIATVRNKGIAGGLFAKEYLVVTDQAIYAVEDGGTRFPLKELSKYIVVIRNGGNVYLNHQEKQYHIVGNLLMAVSKNRAGESVLRMVKALQRVAIEETEQGKKERENLCTWLLSIVDKEKEEGKVSDNTMYMLESMLETDSELGDRPGRCLIGYAVSTCDIRSIEESICKVLRAIGSGDKAKLTGWYKEEVNGYISRLRNPAVDFKDDYIKLAYKNICNSSETCR